MNPDPPKLRRQELQQHAAELQQKLQTQTPHEFASVEELIRHDARHTPVPPVIAERLHDSLAREPKPQGSWWRRLFS